ncbi:hypothetical protein [Stenotrophomonas sp. NPDC078853]|uniref:hypothetical protein n=1 Tax=Stenotrophomonas sp. NPDC078853 TaxID=3364534 RepID=UPI00384D292C
MSALLLQLPTRAQRAAGAASAVAQAAVRMGLFADQVAAAADIAAHGVLIGRKSAARAITDTKKALQLSKRATGGNAA